MVNNLTRGGLLVALVAVGLGGCSSFPTAGPTTKQVVNRAEGEQHLYDLIPIDDRVVAATSVRPARSLRGRFEDIGRPSARIGVGDLLAVTIWEAQSGGLFGSEAGTAATTAAGGRSVSLPAQEVAEDGSISVPYAGRVRAAGRTPFQVQREIQDALASRAIEPQAIVTVTKSAAGTVTVLGDVVNSVQIPLSIRGQRLLEVAAAAGGVKAPLYETVIRLTRNGRTVTVPLDTLAADPEQDIYARPGDIITLVRRPKTFMVFGATGPGGGSGGNNLITFGAERLDLAEAMAKAGGLVDLRADPSGVFLFRFESTSTLRALGAPILTSPPSTTSPVLYHLDMRDPASYFLAKRFPVEEGDVVYVANAEATEWQKFANFIATLSYPVISGVLLFK